MVVNANIVCSRTAGSYEIGLEEIHSSAVLNLLCFSFNEVAVGVRESDERDQSAPAQTASQQAGFRSY